MKRWIHADTTKFKSTRGHGSTVSGDKKRLRNIVDNIYDEVEKRKLINWWGLIKSAGKGYYIDWFRFNDGWMLADRAQDFAQSVEEVIDDLGYSGQAGVVFLRNSVNRINEEEGGQCYLVRVVVKEPLEIDPRNQNPETTKLVH